jgi:hypothetical protein
LADQSEPVSTEMEVADCCDLCDWGAVKSTERGDQVPGDRLAVDLDVDGCAGTGSEAVDVGSAGVAGRTDFDRLCPAPVVDVEAQWTIGQATPGELRSRVLYREHFGR